MKHTTGRVFCGAERRETCLACTTYTTKKTINRKCTHRLLDTREPCRTYWTCPFLFPSNFFSLSLIFIVIIFIVISFFFETLSRTFFESPHSLNSALFYLVAAWMPDQVDMDCDSRPHSQHCHARHN